MKLLFIAAGILLAGAQSPQSQIDTITAKITALDATVQTFVALGPVKAGASGALDCVDFGANTCDIVTAIVPLKPAANAWTGANDFTKAAWLAIPTGTPASSSAPCTAGQIEHDNAYIYVCVTSGSWTRSALASW